MGASPQLTYRLFLERLCARANVTIVATPFAIGFDHLRIADDAQFAFDRALRALVAEDATRYASIPTFGVGHSMGALLHSIIGARYELANSTRRCGNALMSFNNKPATDAIPAFAEAVAPGMQALSPVLSAALNNPVSVFLVIFGYFWLFLVILVWAIRLTSCFLFTGERFFTKRRRRHRSIVCFRARSRPGASAGAGPDRAGVHGGCERRGGVCAETGGYQGAHSGALFGSEDAFGESILILLAWAMLLTSCFVYRFGSKTTPSTRRARLRLRSWVPKPRTQRTQGTHHPNHLPINPLRWT